MSNVDWVQLWQDLVEQFKEAYEQGEKGLMARWGKRARSAGYTEEMRKRDWNDPLMQFVLNNLCPDDTVLDVGSAIGRWSIPMAMVARKVTALDALPGMLKIVRENASAEGVDNIEMVQGDWSSVEIEPHDYTLSSHAMYTSPDIVAYARKMERLARKACYMVMRIPKHDGLIGDLSMRINSCWHDSTNFVVGYNALLQVGINPHVVMEESWRFWHNGSLEDALVRAKRHLRIVCNDHDSMIMEALRDRLVLRDGEYYWPDGMRSALVWWRPAI